MSRARRIVKVVAVVVAAASLCLGAAACGGSGAAREKQAADARTLALARNEFAAAGDALVAHERDTFLARLPVDGGSPAASGLRAGLGAIYDALSRLPWRTFSFSVEPDDRARGVYRVVGAGQLGESGPPDRLGVVRYFRLKTAADRAVVLADLTPANVQRRYLMALHQPVVLRRPGLILLADGWSRSRARTVLAAAAQARPRLAVLGVDTRPTVVVTVFGSAEQVRDALGVDAATARLVFFSHPALRSAKDCWPTYDVAVLGPWIRDLGTSMDDVLTHELAHAYTVRWFDGIKQPSGLLVEGIAQAAEGMSETSSLREEVASGDQLWPLPESFSEADVWKGADSEGVRLGYMVGGSLVGYVVSHWGANRLRPFVQTVARAEPTEAGMDKALGATLGVDWRHFFAGWRRYVLGGG